MNENDSTVRVETKPETVFKKEDSVFACLAFALGFLFVRYVLWCETGFFTTLTFFALIAAFIVFFKRAGFHFSAGETVLSVVAVVFSCVFSLTSNGGVKTLVALFVLGCGAYLVFSVSHPRGKTGEYLASDLSASLFLMPFGSFGKAPRAINQSAKGSSASRAIKQILIGIAVAIPVVLVVALLLSLADPDFENALSRIFGNAPGNLLIFILQVALGIPVAFYLFGMYYSNKNGLFTDKVSDEANAARSEKGRAIPNLALYAGTVPVLALYAIFFGTQWKYFMSAFTGVLPAGYTYAQYARRGFFELFALAIINLGIIFVISRFAKNSGKNKTLAHRIFCALISVFTLLIIATALSKMALYITRYGLTSNRVFATFIMLALAVTFVFVIVRQIFDRFPLVRVTAIVCTALFAVFAFSTPDARIAQFNIEMHKNGSHAELDAEYLMHGMSNDALAYIKYSGSEDYITDNSNLDAAEIIAERKAGLSEHDMRFSTYNLAGMYLKNSD